MNEDIIVENAGPVERVVITCPKDGGVVEILGQNGVGKTHVLNAIDATIHQAGKIPARDGTSAAEAEVFGVTARFSRRTSFSGELECEILDGRFSIADIIDPGFDKPETRDQRRIKALVQLVTGEETAKPELFYELLPGGKEEFDQEVSLRAQAETDVVAMAAQVKRDLEAASRRDAELAEKAKLQVNVTKQAITNVKLDVETDEKLLTKRHEDAVRSLGKLEAEANAITKANQRARDAKIRLDALPKTEPVSYFEKTLKTSNEHLSRLKDEKRDLEERLKAIQNQLTSQAQIVGMAEQALVAASKRQDLIFAWEADIAAGESELISEEQLSQARITVEDTRQAMELGRDARKVREQLVKADENKRLANELAKKAAQLRSAAQGTDGILSKIVQQLDCPLKVSRGRLVTPTDRGDEVFDDLSDGERVRLVIEIAVAAVKRANRGSLITVPQRAWQDLNPARRQQINELLQGTGVVLVTARATDDYEIHSKILESEPALAP